MRMSQLLSGLAGLAFVALGTVASAHADTVSGNFYATDSTWWGTPPAAYQTLAPADSAGAVAATGWQNILVPEATNSSLTLTDNHGNSAATLYIPNGIIGARNGSGFVTATPVASNWNSGLPTSETTQNKLYAAGSGFPNTYANEMQFSNIPYANYSIYVYLGIQSGYSASAQIFAGASNTASQTYYAQNGGWDYGNPSPNSYVQATSTDSANPTDGGNYVLFSGLTGSSQTIDVNYANAQDGVIVSGFQIVQAVPEPASMVLLGAGALLLIPRRRNRA